MGRRISDRLWGADRAVLYDRNAVTTLAELDGSRRIGIRQQLEKFLDSPSRAFDKSVGSFVHQARHLDSNTRAFATWCQNKAASRELCVVHTVYRKKNEKHYFGKLDEVNEVGRRWVAEVGDQTAADFDAAIDSRRGDDTYIVKTTW